MILTFEYILTKFKELDIEIIELDYKSTKSIGKFRNIKTKKEFTSIVRDVIAGKSLGKDRKLSNIISIEELKKRLPDYIIIDESTYIGATKVCRFIDKEYGEFFTTTKELLKGYGHRQRSFKEGKSLIYTYEEISKLIPNYVKIDKDSYVNTNTKCKCIDLEFGEFYIKPASLLLGYNNKKRAEINRRQTCIKKYGVPHASMNEEVFKKIKKSSKKTKVIKHWKTNEELYCTASYEIAVVNFLNKYKIDFDWQIKFQLDCGIYYCDLFLKEENTYIEIKGYFRQEISRKKWEEFHNKFINSELWSYKELKSMTII